MSNKKTDKKRLKRRAACVCVRDDKEDEVLLVTSSHKVDNWLFPGGGIENDETSEEAALREAFEEAGVKGYISRFLGVYHNAQKTKETEVYVLVVNTESDDYEDKLKFGRQRKWYDIKEAKRLLEQNKPLQSYFLDSLKGLANNSVLKN